MSRGGRSARMDPLAWWSSVKVRDKREGSSDPESGNASRVPSTSRRNSWSSHNEHSGFFGRKSEIFSIEPEDESKENEFGQSLQDELVPAYLGDSMLTSHRITVVISKLSQHKVRLEKVSLISLPPVFRPHPGQSTISPRNAPSRWVSMDPGVNLRRCSSG